MLPVEQLLGLIKGGSGLDGHQIASLNLLLQGRFKDILTVANPHNDPGMLPDVSVPPDRDTRFKSATDKNVGEQNRGVFAITSRFLPGLPGNFPDLPGPSLPGLPGLPGHTRTPVLIKFVFAMIGDLSP